MALEQDRIMDIHKNQGFQNEVLRYLSHQIAQARKTPGITKLYTVNLLNPQSPSPQAIQILGKNDDRESVGITNLAGEDCIISEEWFDPNTVLAMFSDPNVPSAGFSQNVVLPFGLLTVGGNVSLDGTMGIWAYALGSGSSTASVITMADSIYSVKRTIPNNQVEAFHLSGLHPDEQPGKGLVK